MLLRLRMPVHEKTALAFLQQKVRAVFIGKIIFELLYDASSSHSDRISVSYIENNSIESMYNSKFMRFFYSSEELSSMACFSAKTRSYSAKIASLILFLVSDTRGWAISRKSPSPIFLLGIAINSPFCPSMILISCTTNSSSNVIDTTAVSYTHLLP